MKLQQVEIETSDPIFCDFPSEEELIRKYLFTWVKQHRIKYKFDTYEREEELVEAAVREAIVDCEDVSCKNDDRPFFIRSRPKSIVEIDADQTKYLFGKKWDAEAGWDDELSGFCLLHKKNKTVLLEFVSGAFAFLGDLESPYWE